MEPQIRADLFFGTAYGLAVSAVIWVLALHAPPLNATNLLLLTAAAAAGTVRWRLRWIGKLPAAYSLVLAALLISGPGLSLLTGLVVAATAGLCLHPRRRRVRYALLEVSGTVLATAVSCTVFLLLLDSPALGQTALGLAPLVGHATAYALVLRGLAFLALKFSERPGRAVLGWRGFLRTAATFAVGIPCAAGLAWAYALPDARLWLLSIAAALVTYALYRARQRPRRLRRLYDLERDGLQQKMVEALAKTMEAKDEDTRSHLHRVQQLCLSVGSAMELSAKDLEILASAALLHDIGKVAVPEGILTKPCRLTHSEMERIKVHPSVGADILDTIPFPYPLSSIVRHHHERWDGRGYPSGLRGEQIPLGSRILAAVDTFDALTSDRPYRKALPAEKALEFLERESEKMFDPVVVDALVEHVEDHAAEFESDSVSPKSAGSATETEDTAEPTVGHLPLAQRELQALYDISRAMGYGLDLEEYLTIVACKLASLVPYQSLVVYFLEPEDKLLRAGFSLGLAADKLRLMTIPLGERLSGWSALQQRACIGQDHRSPLERDGARSDLEDWGDDPEMSRLNSTLAAPMVAGEKTVGVITLYDHAGRRFTDDERRILIRVAGYTALVAERTGEAPPAGAASLTDPLTGVPNARFLWLESAHRITQAAEGTSGFGLLAFHASGLDGVCERLGNAAADRLLCQIARRFASSLEQSETLVRFGHDLFLVMTPSRKPGELVQRWHDLTAAVEQSSFAPHPELTYSLRLTAAHALYPEDGRSLDALLETLDSRLTHAAQRGRTVIPFRSQRAAASN